MYSFTIEVHHVEYKNKSDISNNRGCWSRLKVIRKLREQHDIRQLLKTAMLGTAPIFGNMTM